MRLMEVEWELERRRMLVFRQELGPGTLHLVFRQELEPGTQLVVLARVQVGRRIRVVLARVLVGRKIPVVGGVRVGLLVHSLLVDRMRCLEEVVQVLKAQLELLELPESQGLERRNVLVPRD